MRCVKKYSTGCVTLFECDQEPPAVLVRVQLLPKTFFSPRQHLCVGLELVQIPVDTLHKQYHIRRHGLVQILEALAINLHLLTILDDGDGPDILQRKDLAIFPRRPDVDRLFADVHSVLT